MFSLLDVISYIPFLVQTYSELKQMYFSLKIFVYLSKRLFNHETML